MRIEILRSAHAKALIAQDDVADTENRDLGRMQHIVNHRRFFTAVAKYVSHVHSPSLSRVRAALFFSCFYMEARQNNAMLPY